MVTTSPFAARVDSNFLSTEILLTLISIYPLSLVYNIALSKIFSEKVFSNGVSPSVAVQHNLTSVISNALFVQIILLILPIATFSYISLLIS